MEERYTDIRLLKVPIELDNKNQLNFSSKTTQYNYFNGCTKIDIDDSSYQRKDNTIRYPGHIDDLIGYNYCMYKNTTYSNKWFYAFITDMRYMSDSMTLITIKTDVWQTWFDDIEIKKCFVEREHVNDDTLGLHTIPEGLETGAYKVYSHLSDSSNNQLCFVTLSTVGPSDLENYSLALYNGIPTPGIYCKWSMDSTGLSNLATFLNNLNSNSKIEAMNCMFLAPEWLVPTNGTVYVTTSTTVPSISLGISRISSLDGYTPKNKKLLCYPYCYIGVSNGIGQYNTYKQERWSLDANNEMKLTMRGVLTPGGSIRAFPENYNGDGVGTDESITVGKFPQLAWSNDLYTNWQTQNGVNLGGIKLNATEYGIARSALQLGIGGALLASGNIMGATMIGGGIGEAFNAVQENYQHSLAPNAIEGSINSGDVTTMVGMNRLHAYRMGITSEYAQVIDSFLSTYGYKVNSVKVPNITGRLNWNYVKTIDCNIHGYIPQKDCIEIKNMFNAGVTFWHDPSKFLDYSQPNTIVS